MSLQVSVVISKQLFLENDMQQDYKNTRFKHRFDHKNGVIKPPIDYELLKLDGEIRTWKLASYWALGVLALVLIGVVVSVFWTGRG